jgi:hypothetical protein
MKELIKKVPVPLCGLMLGTAALGNLLQSYSEIAKNICGIVSAFLLILILLKIICFPSMIGEEMKNPVSASVMGTCSMGIMILSTYLKPYIGQAAFVVWAIAVFLHILLIIYFSFKFIMKLDMTKVFASYYIVYVGIVTASVTAPAFEMTTFGNFAFWFGFITFVLLFILVSIRHVKFTQIPDPAKPLICIYTAPLSLCIAGYIQSVTPKSLNFVIAMLIVATAIYVFALIQAIKCLKFAFYPSFASFTFPFVISAIAAKQTMAFAAKQEVVLPLIKYLVIFETVVAVAFVVYTFIGFMKFIFVKK